MKKLKPILLESENGCFQFKAIDYNKTILQESNIEDVAKYNIILVDLESNEFSDGDLIYFNKHIEIYNSKNQCFYLDHDLFKVIAVSNANNSGTSILSKNAIESLLNSYNKNNKLPEFVNPNGYLDFNDSLEIIFYYELERIDNKLFLDIKIEDLESDKATNITVDKIIDVANEISKTIINKQFGYIMLPDLNGFKMFKIEKDRLEEYLAIESLSENNK